MRWSREEYIELMTYGKVERQMFVELFGPLIGLEDEWRAAGATEEEINLTAFDFDYVPRCGCGGNTGLVGGFTPCVLEETAEHVISRDNLGRTVKLCKGKATIPLPLDFPVKDMDSWLKVKPFYEFNESRINWDEVERAAKNQQNGALVLASIPGAFDTPRELMGEEAMCIAYYEDPELMEDIMATLTDTSFKVLDRISDKVVIDNLCVHEDMAGKSGPLIGPAQIREYMKPYYRKIWDMLSSKGTRLFSQDSDGDMTPVISDIIDCGVNITYPCEPAAGMDAVALRKRYGTKIAFKGAIDKHVLRKSKAEIVAELEYKLQPLMRQGGCVFGLDHRIPNGTPIENYRFYVNTAREILGLAPLDGKTKGWSRMAF